MPVNAPARCPQPGCNAPLNDDGLHPNTGPVRMLYVDFDNPTVRRQLAYALYFESATVPVCPLRRLEEAAGRILERFFAECPHLPHYVVPYTGNDPRFHLVMYCGFCDPCFANLVERTREESA
ncbi:hypothetical protein ATEIFO6365_0012042000 [Aspergillus terreus]|uniref:Uncharacterized protein n=1 Tax=Aspergillus terreus TaxID=33178 RepID=A0A5M3ZCW9_ASPTE|nr:hypothetical protein ATETN484_0015002200 [Aspergillus terreus]GFF20663.1 hypothetical protein ATEIFO6365_0012042000 [Aspergillus terreus]